MRTGQSACARSTLRAKRSRAGGPSALLVEVLVALRAVRSCVCSVRPTRKAWPPRGRFFELTYSNTTPRPRPSSVAIRERRDLE